MADLSARKHIFFDLDDTLWDFAENSSKVLRQLYDEFRMAGKLNVTADVFLEHYRLLNLRLWSKFYRRELNKHEMRTVRFRMAFENFGYSDPAESIRFSDRYIELAPHGTVLKEGCIETLEYLQKNYHLHLITNGFIETQAIKIDACQLRRFFRNIIISEEHGLVKPEEKIFRLAENLAGASRNDCVMIGDSIESDVNGAISAGWKAILIADENSPDNKGMYIRSLPELRNFF